MAINAIGVRSKPFAKRRRIRVGKWVYVVAAVLLAVGGPLWYDAVYGRLGIVGPQPVIESNAMGTVIKVPPGGNVQAAIERANSGDIVELQAGAVYSGTVNLPNKPLTDYVTIRSSAAADLPADKRVSPADRRSMATITAGILGRPAVAASKGANHYRFVGIEFTSASTMFNYGIVELGRGEAVAQLPHDIEIDRSYIHPHKIGVARRGIALNSANTTVKNSYIEGFGFPGEETQGICGWSGTRNVHILNNYVEGGAENIMFGGSDPDSADLIPIDIEIRGNHLNKPQEWSKNTTVKTLFELKNAKRVQLVGNLLTNNWKGSAFRITIRNQDGGATFSTIEDVVIKDNVVDGSGDGINILGKDDNYPSGTLKRLTIENNVFLNITSNANTEGSGYFVQAADGEDITIANNTSFNTGNIATFYGVMPRNFVFRDNIVGHGNYGVHGPINMNSEVARAMFQGNIFMNLNAVGSGDYAFPAGNTMLDSGNAIGFTNIGEKDFRLGSNSKFKGKGRGGKNPGADLSPSDFPR